MKEKEKKENGTLCVITPSLLWLSIQMLSERTILGIQAAQNIYNAICQQVGLQAGVLPDSSKDIDLLLK